VPSLSHPGNATSGPGHGEGSRGHGPRSRPLRLRQPSCICLLQSSLSRLSSGAEPSDDGKRVAWHLFCPSQYRGVEPHPELDINDKQGNPLTDGAKLTAGAIRIDPARAA